jgi:hypothetical protein
MLVKAINLMVFLHRADPIVKAESQLGTLYLFIFAISEWAFSRRKIEIIPHTNNHFQSHKSGMPFYINI